METRSRNRIFRHHWKLGWYKISSESSDDLGTKIGSSFDEDASLNRVFARRARTKCPNVPLSAQQRNKKMKQVGFPTMLVEAARKLRQKEASLLE